MEDCLFCKIIEGEIPSKTIYEDEIVKVMMDINPISDGHLLVLPKKHNKDLTARAESLSIEQFVEISNNL